MRRFVSWSHFPCRQTAERLKLGLTRSSGASRSSIERVLVSLQDLVSTSKDRASPHDPSGAGDTRVEISRAEGRLLVRTVGESPSRRGHCLRYVGLNQRIGCSRSVATPCTRRRRVPPAGFRENA